MSKNENKDGKPKNLEKPKIIKKPKAVQKPKYVKKERFFACDVKLPEIEPDSEGNIKQLTFNEVIEFYKPHFLKQICLIGDDLENIRLKKYMIDPRTGYPGESHIISFPYEPQNNNFVKYENRNIILPLYLRDSKFSDSVIKHYKVYGHDAEIYESGYNRDKKRYSRINIKIYI